MGDAASGKGCLVVETSGHADPGSAGSTGHLHVGVGVTDIDHRAAHAGLADRGDKRVGVRLAARRLAVEDGRREQLLNAEVAELRGNDRAWAG